MKTDASNSEMPPLDEAFVHRITQDFPDEAGALLRCLDETEPSCAIRLNPAKRLKYGFTADHLPVETQIPWCSDGYFLTERPFFAWDPLWHAAAYYVQDAASQALSVIKPYLPTEPIRALDLCAAPGGKATLLSALLPEGSLLVANEPIRKRAAVLAENIAKWGYPETIVTSVMPERLADTRMQFELILVDAPCSGEGMFRKSVAARTDWSPATVDNCVARQRQILDAAFRLLSPGGLLIYATCTFNRAENEGQLAYLLDKGCQPLSLNIPEAWNWYATSSASFHLFPHRIKGEGLFLSFIRKNEAATNEPIRPIRIKNFGNKPSKPCIDWIVGDRFRQGTIHRTEQNECFLLSDPVAEACMYLAANRINPLFAGIPLAEQKGSEWVEHAMLPWSLPFCCDAFETVELTTDQALRYLSGEALMSESNRRGTVVFTYGGVPLGFGKRVGLRTNSRYPKSCRLKLLPPRA